MTVHNAAQQHSCMSLGLYAEGQASEGQEEGNQTSGEKNLNCL